MTRYCKVDGCHNVAYETSVYCQEHNPDIGVDKVITTYDHLKIAIEQTAKGARVTVTYDRSDHDIHTAVFNAVTMYKDTISLLQKENMKVDEA